MMLIRIYQCHDFPSLSSAVCSTELLCVSFLRPWFFTLFMEGGKKAMSSNPVSKMDTLLELFNLLRWPRHALTTGGLQVHELSSKNATSELCKWKEGNVLKIPEEE